MRAPIVAAISLALAAGAHAQVRLGERVEEGVTDYEPSRLGMRVVNPDYRLDTGFDHIYRVEGRDDLFARRHGGVTAVFPRSVYYRTRRGVEYTVIPAGTVFYISDARELPQPDPPAPRPTTGKALAGPLSAPVPSRIDLTSPPLSLAVLAGAPPADAPIAQAELKPAAPQRSRTMSDETYRRTRLRELALRFGPPAD